MSVKCRLVCPTCRRDLVFTLSAAACPTCHIAVPVVNGFPLMGEVFLDPADADARSQELIADQGCYRNLLERRRVRHLYEPYAWFRPFNESSRALEPFRALLTEAIPAGAPILDLWCRTGWTGELLASWFPDNPVVSLWEGDVDHLGYQGYFHWLPPGRRAPNLDIVFATPGEPLPFADGYFGFVHGLDTLHRYPHRPLVGECLRVAAADAPIIFPHVHLTNSEPDPFFERGCMQYHGRVWGGFLDRLTAGTARAAWVLSEKALYTMTEPTPLADDRDTGHYNALVAMGPAEWNGRFLMPQRAKPPTPAAYVFANPMLALDTVTGRLRVDDDGLSGTVAYMAKRHPVAVDELATATARELTSIESQILNRATRPVTIAQVASALDHPVDDIVAACGRLVAENVIVAEAVSPAMARLQNHYATLHPERSERFAGVWAMLAVRYQERPVVVAADGSSFDFADVELIVSALRCWFGEAGLGAGDRVAISAANHAEYLFTVWASWLTGLVAVPLSPLMSGAQFESTLAALDIGAVFCDAATHDRLGPAAAGLGVPCVVFDEAADSAETQAATPTAFADVVAPFFDVAPPVIFDAADEVAAAIISTSGSTGPPKLVELADTALWHNAAALVGLTGLGPDDRLLNPGAIHTMSGLRNPAAVALRAGATIVIDAEAATSALAAADACRRHKVTVLGASAALIDTLDGLASRVDAAMMRSVRMILSAADALDVASAVAVAERYDVEVVDYYGLTETGGSVFGRFADRGDVGFVPMGAAVEVCADGRRLPPGELGEIRISTPSLMLGYRLPCEGVRVEHGWLYTGDLGQAVDDGSIRLLGRIAPQIKRRDGEIYPHRNVVAHLESLPGVEQAVVSTDDLRHVVAHVTAEPRQTAASLMQSIADALGPEALPDRIELALTPPRGADVD